MEDWHVSILPSTVTSRLDGTRYLGVLAFGALPTRYFVLHITLRGPMSVSISRGAAELGARVRTLIFRCRQLMQAMIG